MKRLLFLDVDGVLNNTAWFVAQHERRVAGLPTSRRELDPENMRQLADLLLRVRGLDVVVSSSWRCGRTLGWLRDTLVSGPFMTGVPFARTRIVGMTPRLESRLRHEEIRAWLAEHAPDAVFLAVDDDTFDMEPLGDGFLHVHRDAGLTPAHVELVVKHFLAEKA